MVSKKEKSLCPTIAQRSFAAFCLGHAILVFAGCNSKAVNFAPNELMQHRMERELRTDLHSVANQIANALNDAFGEPDEPKWPKALVDRPQFTELVDQESLVRAAGPVGRRLDQTEVGLFRKQCAQCHGITGNGLGPTAALLDPYPRDFRRGTIKYKSAPYGNRPTIEDLTQTIENGIPGTSMPAMANLKRSKHYADDIPVLAKYVRFLAIRGEVERELMMNIAPVLDEDELLYDRDLKDKAAENFAANQERIDAAIVQVAEKWIATAESSYERFLQTNPESNGTIQLEMKSMKREEFDSSIARGKEIFEGTTVACFQCHGKNGLGDSKWKDFDEWTKDWTIRAGIDPTKKSEWAPLKKLGLLKPVRCSPRNLTLGVYRGTPSPLSPSNDPAVVDSDAKLQLATRPSRLSILRAVLNGIEGSPMPAAPLAGSTVGGLEDSQIIDLVRYVESLALDNFLPASTPVTPPVTEDLSS